MSATEATTEWYTEVAPSGIEIRYRAKPRGYEIRGKDQCRDCLVNDGLNDIEAPYLSYCSLCEVTEWSEVPSVTTVLGVLDKPALPWWGMKVGVEGVKELYEQHKVDCTRLSTEAAIEALTNHKLTVNHQRDKAGDRGSRVHAAFEEWAKTERVPNPDDFSDEDRGYVKGLVKFLEEVQPRPRACEVLVGSLEHGYAGRYDLRALLERERKVVYKRTPKRGDHFARIAPGNLLVDLKTSKSVYPSHSLQLEAYEQASVECGYPPTDARGILQVSDDGGYQFVRSVADFQDFANVLAVYNSLEAMKGRKQK